MKKVSVIIPTYNRGEFLQKAVESIVQQNYPDVEIVIVDDGSTDNTESIVKVISDKYPFVLYCKNTRTKGPSGARNTGILKASGDYLAFLDSDDVWLEGHLKNGVKVLEDPPDIGVLFGNYQVIDYYTGKHLYNFFDRKRILPSLKSSKLTFGVRMLKEDIFEALLKENFFSLGTSLIRKSLLLTNRILLNESLMYGEDRDFAIQLCRKANAAFAYREIPVYIAYKHDSNLTDASNVRKKQKHSENIIFLYKKYMLEYQLSDSERKTLKTLISERLLRFSYLYRKNNDFKHAFITIIESAKYKLSFRQIIELCKILAAQFIFFLVHRRFLWKT